MSKKKELVPKRRFKEFENAPAWKQRKLMNLYKEGASGGTPNTSKTEYYNGCIPFLGISDITNSNGYIHKTEKTITIEGLNNSTSWLVPSESISLAMYASVGKVAILKTNVATSQAFYNMVFNDLTKRDFIFQYLLKTEVENGWEENISTGTQGNLNAAKVKSFKVNIPISSKEQRKISDFLFNLDNLITRHQRKLEKMKELKKSYLSEMFPAEGERKPKRRFAGFTDDWEQRKFGDFFDPIPNNSLSRANLNYSRGKIKNIHYGDILINFGDILKYDDQKIPYITDARLIDYHNQLLKDGDIIIADAAEDHSVGKAIEIIGVYQNYIVAGLHTIACRPREKVHPRFMGYLMNSSAYQNQLLSIMQGIKVFSVSRTNLADTLFHVPLENQEQGKIASLFSNLDNLITLHQRKLEKLKNIKKAYLNEMFPRTERE